VKLGALAAVAFLGAACVTLPVPTPADVDRARVAGRETSVDALTAGRRAYLARCGSCHQYYPPQAHAAERWPLLVDDMRERAKLADDDRARILDYLVTLSVSP
jgi:hypothetical protein